MSITLTCYSVPRTDERRDKAQIPMGVVLNPTSALENLPIIDRHPRCSKCYAYLTRSECLFCQTHNVIQDQIQPSDNYLIPSHYYQPKVLIIIDGSNHEHNSQFFCSTIKSIESICQSRFRNVAFAVLTSTLTFFTPNNSFLSVVDLDESMFPPNVFFDVAPSSLSALNALQTDGRVCDVLGALSCAASSLSQYDRVVMFLASIPRGTFSFDYSAPEKNGSPLFGNNYTPYMENLQRKFSKRQIIPDFFVYGHSSKLIDVPTLCRFCEPLGGQVEYVDHVVDFTDFLCSPTYVASLQCTVKLLPSLGHSQFRPNSIAAAGNHSFVFPLVLKGVLPEVIYFQSIVELNYPDGRQITHVTNINAMTTDDLSLAFKKCHYPSILKYCAGSLINLFYFNKTPLLHMKTAALALLSPIFRTYRTYVNTSPNRMQNFVMPGSLKLLPLCVLGLLKSTAFSGGKSDEWAYELFAVNRASTDELCVIAHPQLFDITTMTLLSPTRESLQEGHVYVLYDGFGTWTYGDHAEIAKQQEKFLIKGRYHQNEAGFFERLVVDKSAMLPSHMEWLTELNALSI